MPFPALLSWGHYYKSVRPVFLCPYSPLSPYLLPASISLGAFMSPVACCACFVEKNNNYRGQTLCLLVWLRLPILSPPCFLSLAYQGSPNRKLQVMATGLALRAWPLRLLPPFSVMWQPLYHGSLLP